MEIFISIGERLREARIAMGKSQTEFADIAAAAGVPGATRQSQANYEKGRQMPSAAYLAAIAEAGADILYVVTGRLGGDANVAMSSHLPPDEQLLLEAYRGMSAPARKKLLAALLTGECNSKAKPKAAGKTEGIKVSGRGNKVAGRDFNERKE